MINIVHLLHALCQPHSRTLLTGLIGLATLAACSKARERGPSPVDVLVSGITQEQILVDVAAFEAQTEALHEAATTFCEAPATDDLSAARTQWQKTAESWYRVQLFNFGPADADPVFPLFTFIDSLRLRGMDYTESLRSRQQTLLSGDEKLDEAFFTGLHFDEVGLLALEVALFADDDLVAAYENEPRRCELLLGLCEQLRARARVLQRGWSDDYEDSGRPFADLLREGDLPNGRYPLVQIVISAQEYLDYLHDRKVVNLAGKVSNTSWELLAAALDAIEQLLQGDIEGGSIIDWMQRLGDPAAAQKVEDDLEVARAALKDQDVEAFEAALATLDGDFKREVPDALGIQLGLNFTDGD